MGKNSRGVAHVILLAIFIPIAIGLTLAFKTTFDKISSPSTPDSEEREISRSFFGDLLEGVGGALAPLSTQEPDAESATESEQATSPDSASAKDIAGDTTPPTITQMTGPADGSTISFNSFGFPIKASDNVSKYPNIWVRVKFDSDSWSGWSTNFSPYYNNVSEGSHSFSAQVKDEAGNLSSIVTRTFTVQLPKPLSISGQTFSDNNNNSIKDSGEAGLKITLALYKKEGGNWVYNQTIRTDDQGNFSFQLSTIGSYQLEPNQITFYDKPGPVEFTVDGSGGSKNYMFPYYPTSSQSGFIIYVFNDKNENSARDSNEEYIHYQNVDVTNTTTGYNWKAGVGVDGFDKIPADYGNYEVELVPQDSSWAYYYKITKGKASFTISSTSSTVTIELGAHKLY